MCTCGHVCVPTYFFFFVSLCVCVGVIAYFWYFVYMNVTRECLHLLCVKEKKYGEGRKIRGWDGVMNDFSSFQEASIFDALRRRFQNQDMVL